MVLADGVGGREGIIVQLVVLGDLPHQVGRRLPAGQLLAQESVEHGAGGIAGLEIVLNIKSLEDVLGVADRQVGAVGVVGGTAGLSRGDDVGVELHIVLGQAVGGGLRRGGLQVVQVAVHLLVIAEPFPHVIQHLLGEVLALGGGHVGTDPLGVEAGLIHTHQADGGEVVVKAAQVVLGVGVETGFQQLGDDGALDFQGAGGQIHQLVQPGIEVLLVLGQVGQTGHIQRHHAHRAGGFTGAEVAAGLLAQLTQVQPQAAAHGADVGRLHVGVDVVGEVGSAVLGGHLEKQFVVLRGGPVKVPGNGVGGDGVLEAAAMGVALDHDVDKGLVDHVHLGLAVAIGEVHLLAAHDGGQILQVGGNGPVQGDVGEGRLGAPAGGGIHAEDEALDALLHFLVAQVVHLDEGGQIGVKGGEGLGAGPLVLHDAQEVDHLVAEGGQVAGGGGIDLARDAQPLLDQLLQAPAGAVAGEHGQVMQVQIAVAVGIGDLLVVHLAEPVVGGDGAGVGEDQTAHGVGDGGVLLHAPVLNVQILVHRLLIIQIGRLGVAQLLPLLAVKNVGLGNGFIAASGEDGLHAVLHILHGHLAVLDLGQEVGRDLQGQKVDDTVVIIGVGGFKSLLDGGGDLVDVKLNDLAVPLYDLIHIHILLFVSVIRL